MRNSVSSHDTIIITSLQEMSRQIIRFIIENFYKKLANIAKKNIIDKAEIGCYD